PDPPATLSTRGGRPLRHGVVSSTGRGRRRRRSVNRARRRRGAPRASGDTDGGPATALLPFSAAPGRTMKTIAGWNSYSDSRLGSLGPSWLRPESSKLFGG